jgi:hypothetical protein
MPLKDLEIKALQPSEAPYRKTDSGGLYLEVHPSGSKLWRWKYRFAGKESRLALGAYPQVSLKDARSRRDAEKAKVAAGTVLLYADQVTVGSIADEGCTLLELEVFGKRVLAVNDWGADIDLAYYQPGLWESWFGVDNHGDTVTHDVMPYQDRDNPGAVTIPENARFSEKPIHAATRSVEAPDDSKLFKRRRMDSGIAPYGPTSKLRVHSGQQP